MLKTQVVKKRKKENRLYTHYGFYKWQNVLVDIIKISLGIFLYHICFLLYFKIFSIKYIFFNIDSLHNIYYDFIFRYFSLFKVTLLFELIHILFLTPYLIMFWYIFYAYKGFKKSQLQQKMSNLGLESYILRKKEYGYLLKLRAGEEIAHTHIDNITEDIKNEKKELYEVSIPIFWGGPVDKTSIFILHTKDYKSETTENYNSFSKANQNKLITSAISVGIGGLGIALSKMAIASDRKSVV